MSETEATVLIPREEKATPSEGRQEGWIEISHDLMVHEPWYKDEDEFLAELSACSGTQSSVHHAAPVSRSDAQASS